MAARKAPAAKAKAKAPAKKAPAKAAAKKAPAKKAAAPKAAAPKTAAAARKVTALSEKYTKTQILNEISENTGLSRKDVTAVMDELSVIIERHIKKRAVGEFTSDRCFLKFHSESGSWCIFHSEQ